MYAFRENQFLSFYFDDFVKSSLCDAYVWPGLTKLGLSPISKYWEMMVLNIHCVELTNSWSYTYQIFTQFKLIPYLQDYSLYKNQAAKFATIFIPC